MSYEEEGSPFEKYYLASYANENRDGSTPIQLCSAERNSLVRLHNEALKKLDNESTCLLLKQHLAEYSKTFHDKSTPNSVNGLAKPIEFLLKGKVQTRHCSSWKSNLRNSNIDPINILKKNLKLDANCNINKNQPCNENDIKNERESLKWLFEKKSSPFQNDNSYPVKPQINNVIKTMSCNENKITPLQNINNQPVNKSYPSFQFKQSNPVSNNKIDTFNSGNVSNDNRTRFNNFKNPLNSIEPQRKVFKTEFNNDAKRSNMNYNNRSNVPNLPDNSPKELPSQPFKTAREELAIQNLKKNGNSKPSYQPHEVVVQKKSLGTTRSVESKFKPPIFKNSNNVHEEEMETDTIEDERLKHIDPKMVELIRSEIIDSSASVGWQDIAGLEFAKSAIQEAVVWPLLRPDIFTGLRRPPRGILLFGPPGTGKTLIGKCIASQCHATFFSISASSLTSKWLGDGEKMVRALFAVARCHQPAVVFIDEIDSLLTQRTDSEHEATRRIKTEFLVQLDGASTGDEDRLLLIGATNRPQELDEAARRRLVKRLYIPLPDFGARKQIVHRLMSSERHSLDEEDIDNVANLAEGFSGADMRSLCGEAALGPIRTLPMSQITNIQSDQVRPINVEDFKNALMRVRPSVSGNDLEHYKKWDLTYGSGSNCS